jgi:hypothetical protein
MLALVDGSKDSYDQSILISSTKAKKGYYNLSTDDRDKFMSRMNGMGGNIPGEEVAYDDDEEQQHESPLFQEDTFKSKRSGQSTTLLSNNNPFADGDEEGSDLNIETFRPKSNKNIGDGKYATMQDLLEGNSSPLGLEKRKGMGGTIDKVFGGKKTKRRKITLVSLILLACGGIGAALYVILGMQGGDVKGAELGSFPTAPSITPSPPLPNGSILGPSFILPSQVMNATVNKTESHNPLTPSMLGNGNVSVIPNATTLSSQPSSTFFPSISPGNASSTFNTSMTPTFNDSFVPSPQPSLLTVNETITDLNGTNTTNGNETGSLVPTPTPFAGNISESPMPTLVNETSNITDLNDTLAPTPASSLNVSSSIMPSIANKTTNMTDMNGTLAPTPTNLTATNASDVNETESLVPTPTNLTATNATDVNETESLVPTPTPFAGNISESLVPTIANETSNITDLDGLNETGIENGTISNLTNGSSLVPTLSPLDANLSLDELSDPWSLSRSIEHDESSARFGTSLVMSADGSLCIVGATDAKNEAGDNSGAVFVYSMVDGDPSLLHVIYGENINDEFGNAIALSDDGSRLVVGSRSEGEQAGAVRIYSLSTSSYSQLGDAIVGSADAGRAGWAVAISGDGNVVAVGSPKGGAEGGGSVLTYQYDGTEWVPFGGSEIEASSSDASMGYSLALNIDGTIVASGNPKAGNRDGSSNAGKVAVYTFVESSWTMTGEVFGESSEDVEGTSVAITPDGRFLVTGSIGVGGADGSMESSGSCQLYQAASSGRWRLKHTLTGQSTDERLG